jgi:uncharacterized protein YxjI
MRYAADTKWHKERFTIDDEAGRPQFEVVRIAGLDGNHLSLRDQSGNKLAAISARTGPTRFEIAGPSLQPITVRHKGWFGTQYSITTPDGEMTAQVGDFSRKDYDVLFAGTVVASVSRGWPRQSKLTILLPDEGYGRDPTSSIAVILAIEALSADRYEATSTIPFVRLILRLIN